MLLFLPLPVCASLLSAIGNTHRSQVLSDLLTRCWNPNSRNLYCLHTLEPQLPLYSTFFRPATNHRLNFLFTVHFSFNLRQYPPTPTAVFFPNISITMQYAPQQHTYTLVLRSIHLATLLCTEKQRHEPIVKHAARQHPPLLGRVDLRADFCRQQWGAGRHNEQSGFGEISATSFQRRVAQHLHSLPRRWQQRQQGNSSERVCARICCVFSLVRCLHHITRSRYLVYI